MARKKLSHWPLIFALVALLLSGILVAIIVPRINTDSALPFAIVGYVLTPFAAAAALIWARSIDLRLSNDPMYLRHQGRDRIKVVGYVVVASFLPALVHIWYLAGYIGVMLS